MAAKPQSNRRQFLTGQAALDAVSNLAADAPSRPLDYRSELSHGEAETYLIQIDRTAMACEFQILLNAGQHPGATEAALDAMDLIERLEEQLSWFRDTSELTRINRMAATSPVVVEQRLFQLLAEAISLSEQTQGAFDITAAPLWKLWGFHRREGKLPAEADIQQALTQRGSHQIRLDTAAQTIQFARDGVEINLGAIGKGYALDRCGEHLVAAGVDNFLIHGGQSSMLARGRRAGVSEVEPSWTVALRHPLKPDQRLAEIHLRDRALGTSGSGNQFFHFGGKRYGHVLDPRTGQPAGALLSATVLAPTAAQADALATAFFVMGLEASIEFCESRPEIGALLVSPGERAGSSELVTVGSGQCEWRQIA
ncbi:MAG: FAD:protein FMN transferase [Planctomycetota bacterium]|nr:FAD:protein FMN transferase [Planctomycetota bacterium]